MKSIIQKYKFCVCFQEVVSHRICLDRKRRQSGEKEINIWFRGFCWILYREISISHTCKIKHVKLVWEKQQVKTKIGVKSENAEFNNLP